MDFAKILGKESGISADGIRAKLTRIKSLPISQSTYPIYDEPLVMDGDALIMTDVEFPFHHADFINRVLGLAKTWGIKQLILGGDVLHFESLSGWQPSWSSVQDGGLPEEIADMIYGFINTLPQKRRAEGEALLDQIGKANEHDGASTELQIARNEIKKLAKQFDKIDYVLGNHEGRFLRAMETAIDPKELLRLLELNEGKWRISPHYFSVLMSNGEKFQIEHPRNTAKYSAWKLSSKYQCHVIMGHSHQLNYSFDISGQFYAIECGHCVDELRLPYAAQRHNTAYAHCLGAVIVRQGVPWLLTAKSDWNSLEKMK